jgi:hypothetical protein
MTRPFETVAAPAAERRVARWTAFDHLLARCGPKLKPVVADLIEISQSPFLETRQNVLRRVTDAISAPLSEDGWGNICPNALRKPHIISLLVRLYRDNHLPVPEFLGRRVPLLSESPPPYIPSAPAMNPLTPAPKRFTPGIRRRGI